MQQLLEKHDLQWLSPWSFLVDMTSNQNAPSTKNGDYDWLMGIFTKLYPISSIY
jgi:hypothetical protein